jgi:aspartyl-tRNA(Asn)/glutamyl-tRNA(Gln) amidotransferase subunit C
MGKLTRDDVLKLSRLARIDLNDDELDKFAEEFNAILGYVEQLQQVDVSGLEPTSQVTGLVNVSRPDEVQDYGYGPDKLLANVPSVKDNQIQVKRVLK